MSLFNVFDIAASNLTAQSVRLNTTASNMANAESGASSADATYKAKQPVFMVDNNIDGSSGSKSGFSEDNDILSNMSSKVKVSHIQESQATPRSSYEPDNPLADANGLVYYPNINIVEQMTDMISASRSFQANVEVLTTTKDLMESALSIGN